MVDSHCHLVDEAFASDLAEVVARARAAGVSEALCIVEGCNGVEEARLGDVLREWPEARAAVGVHPHIAGRFAGGVPGMVDAVGAAVDRQPAVGAIGEIGLDYHYDSAPRPVQRDVFAAQVGLACDRELPVVIHTREADDDTVDILGGEGGGALQGVIHCFTGDDGMVRRYLDLGFFVSFSGIVTFAKAQPLRDRTRLVPDDRLLLETDAPYLAPVPRRGKRNEPAWVTHVLECVAEARGITSEALARQVTANFQRLFRP